MTTMTTMTMTKVKLILCLLAFAIYSPAGGMYSGSVACPSSGNKQILSTSTKAAGFAVQATTTNTGNVSIGGYNVTTSTGVVLRAGDSQGWNPDGRSIYDLSNVYFACTVSADAIVYNYVQ